MSARKRSGRSVAIDTIPLPEKTIGMATKKGRLSRRGSKYYLTLGRRTLEVPVGPIVSTRDISKLVGKEVYAVFSERRKSEIVAIGTWPTPERPKIPPHWIICYIPAPDMIGRVDLRVREALIQQMTREKVITPKLARELKVGLKR